MLTDTSPIRKRTRFQSIKPTPHRAKRVLGTHGFATGVIDEHARGGHVLNGIFRPIEAFFKGALQSTGKFRPNEFVASEAGDIGIQVLALALGHILAKEIHAFGREFETAFVIKNELVLRAVRCSKTHTDCDDWRENTVG